MLWCQVKYTYSPCSESTWTVGSRDYTEESRKKVGVFEVQRSIEKARDAED